MALASSGTISIGGSTANRSINLELNRSATATSSLGESALRTLANRSSGSVSMSHFYGKSNALDVQTVTVGYFAGGQYIPSQYGYSSTLSLGSVSDGTCNFKSGASYIDLYWNSFGRLYFRLNGTHANSGWTTMNIAGTNFSRTSASSFVQAGGGTLWYWDNVSPSPYGTTSGASKTVTFT